MPRIRQKLNKAFLYQQSGKLKSAEKQYRTVLKLDDNNFDANHMLGVIKYQTGNLILAKVYLNKALKIEPKSINALNNIGLVLHGLEEYTLAIANYNRALKLRPDFIEAHFNLANAYLACDRLDTAAESYRTTLKLSPNHYEAMNNLGNILISIGNIEEARQWLSKAVLIKPDNIVNLYSFATMLSHTSVTSELKLMDKLFSNNQLLDSERMLLAYGLGKAFDEMQDYTKAFEYFAAANKLARINTPYKYGEHEKFHLQVAENFNNVFFEKYSRIIDSNFSPIFIVGMPRSATSLIEQILASHSKVYGAGELTLMGELCHKIFVKNKTSYPQQANLLSAEQLQQIANEYSRGLMAKAGTAIIGVDKMPYNYHYIGMIAVIFPNAKFIHLRRNPIDTCLSIYQRYFTAGSHPYAHDLTDLGQYYKLYESLMRHWHIQLPGRILDIEYDELIKNSEHEISNLLDFCNLSFETACIDFHTVNRTVKTASAIQVREPINKKGLNKWKNYRKNLITLQRALS